MSEAAESSPHYNGVDREGDARCSRSWRRLEKCHWLPARWLGLAGVSGVVAYLVSLVALHVLQLQRDPTEHFVSEYVIGDYGEVLAALFIAAFPPLPARASWPPTISERVHDGATLIGFVALIVGAITISSRIAQLPQ